MIKHRIIKQHGLVTFPLPEITAGFVDAPISRPPKRKPPKPREVPEFPFFAAAPNPSLAFAQWSAITFDFTHSRPRFNRQQIDYPLTYAAPNPSVSFAYWSHDRLQRPTIPPRHLPRIPYDGWVFVPPPAIVTRPACVYVTDAELTRTSITIEC